MCATVKSKKNKRPNKENRTWNSEYIYTGDRSFGLGLRVMVMVFNATFNNTSVMSWRPVLLVEKTGVHEENHRSAASH